MKPCLDRCCICQRVSEIVASRIRPYNGQFATVRYCQHCAPESEFSSRQPVTRFKTTSITVAPVPHVSQPTKKTIQAARKPKQLKPLAPKPTELLESGLRLYHIRLLHNGGIVPDEALSQRLSKRGAFAVQIMGTQKFQVIDNLSGLIECKIHDSNRATFIATDLTVHQLINYPDHGSTI